MEWKYVKPLEDVRLIGHYEQDYAVALPEEYKQCVLQNNGGRPAASLFCTAGREHSMKALLSYNTSDAENVWQRHAGLDPQYIPFANDDFGGLVCFSRRDLSVWYWNHETEKAEFVSPSFGAFVNSLFPPEE